MIFIKSHILYVGRVLRPPLSGITVTPNLIQSNIRDFSISIMKTFCKTKYCGDRKNKENLEHSVDKKRYAMA